MRCARLHRHPQRDVQTSPFAAMPGPSPVCPHTVYLANRPSRPLTPTPNPVTPDRPHPVHWSPQIFSVVSGKLTQFPPRVEGRRASPISSEMRSDPRLQSGCRTLQCCSLQPTLQPPNRLGRCSLQHPATRSIFGRPIRRLYPSLRSVANLKFAQIFTEIFFDAALGFTY